LHEHKAIIDCDLFPINSKSFEKIKVNMNSVSGLSHLASASQTMTSSIAVLPDEILADIACLLDTKSLVSLSLSNRRFHSLVSSYTPTSLVLLSARILQKARDLLTDVKEMHYRTNQLVEISWVQSYTDRILAEHIFHMVIDLEKSPFISCPQWLVLAKIQAPIDSKKAKESIKEAYESVLYSQEIQDIFSLLPSLDPKDAREVCLEYAEGMLEIIEHYPYVWVG
jgi:hypothetical protein